MKWDIVILAVGVVAEVLVNGGVNLFVFVVWNWMTQRKTALLSSCTYVTFLINYLSFNLKLFFYCLYPYVSFFLKNSTIDIF